MWWMFAEYRRGECMDSGRLNDRSLRRHDPDQVLRVTALQVV